MTAFWLHHCKSTKNDGINMKKKQDHSRTAILMGGRVKLNRCCSHTVTHNTIAHARTVTQLLYS